LMVFRGRFWTTLFFIAASAGVWYLLEGFTYRMLLAAVPVLFAAQLMLSDALEGMLVSRVGWRTRWFTLLIAPGTILHELCHLLAALATGCTVTKAALFKPNPQTGVLGSVSYTQPSDRWVVFREFIIGFSPFFGCGLLLFAFNMLSGGDLASLVNDAPITDFSQAADLASDIVSSMADAASKLDYDEPLIWLYLYLQVCFSIGAAPSGADFKGSFTSLYKHPLSTLFFAAFIAFLVLASQEHFSLWGYEGRLASAVAASLRFVIVVLLLSIALLLASIPVAYLGVKLAEIKGIAKTIPVTAGALTLYLLREDYGLRYGILGAAAVFTATLLILRYGHLLSGGKKRE